MAAADAPASSDPDLITSIEPATVLRLAAAPSGPWMEQEDEPGVYHDGHDHHIVFVQRPFSRASINYVLVLWAETETDLASGALLEEQPGAWRVVWVKEPALEGAGVLISPEVLQMPLFDLGLGRVAVLHHPHIIGCGAAPCRPEDDFMPSRLLEITEDGLTPLWTLPSGPSCEPEGAKEQPEWVTRGYTCRVGLREDEGDVRDLAVTITLGKGKRAKTTVYRLVGDEYRRRKRR